MQTIRLIYASIAREDLSFAELMKIRTQAKAFNVANRVSGMLCYGNGAFLQLLEGKRKVVNEIYNRIVSDQRHTRTELLSCVPIRKRTFTEWSMKMVSLDEPFAPQRRAILARYSDSPVFEPWLLTNRQAIELLHELAEAERSSTASAHERIVAAHNDFDQTAA
jgi:hypothetical protein